MHISNDPKLLLNLLGECPVRLALGNFDGVHVGHRQLIRQLVEQCNVKGEASVVVTFSPHPSQFFARNSAFQKIDTPEIQRRSLAELGVSGLLELTFDARLATMSGPDFIANVLEVFPLREVGVGADFRFGHDRKGDVNLLINEGKLRGFKVSVMEPVQVGGLTASSSRVRTLISLEGDVSTAANILGRPFALIGKVTHGNKLGRTIGFPTANLADIQQVIPKPGVYAGSLKILTALSNEIAANDRLPCVINIGLRPTVGSSDGMRVEAHVYEHDGTNLDLYGERVEIEFFKRLRDERKFENIEALKRQIARDIDAARA